MKIRALTLTVATFATLAVGGNADADTSETGKGIESPVALADGDAEPDALLPQGRGKSKDKDKDKGKDRDRDQDGDDDDDEKGHGKGNADRDPLAAFEKAVAEHDREVREIETEYEREVARARDKRASRIEKAEAKLRERRARLAKTDQGWIADHIGSDGLVALCHAPPGKPARRETLHVSPRAVEAHLGHGDTLGPCSGQDGAGRPPARDPQGRVPREHPDRDAERPVPSGDGPTARDPRRRPVGGDEGSEKPAPTEGPDAVGGSSGTAGKGGDETGPRPPSDTEKKVLAAYEKELERHTGVIAELDQKQATANRQMREQLQHLRRSEDIRHDNELRKLTKRAGGKKRLQELIAWKSAQPTDKRE